MFYATPLSTFQNCPWKQFITPPPRNILIFFPPWGSWYTLGFFVTFFFLLTWFSLLPVGWDTEARIKPVVALAPFLTAGRVRRGCPMVLGQDRQEGLSFISTELVRFSKIPKSLQCSILFSPSLWMENSQLFIKAYVLKTCPFAKKLEKFLLETSDQILVEILVSP